MTHKALFSRSKAFWKCAGTWIPVLLRNPVGRQSDYPALVFTARLGE